ncbi:MAG: cytochrome c biogenesis protein CcdA [Candidatus Aureabacteria bacterium]|nr:cytochrome c biogenesis protein CcdA [Candidatus Auribacterota bacterium]
MGNSLTDMGLAFFAGVSTFFTPCFLPLLPAYLSFISGLSFSELSVAHGPRKTIVLNTLCFIVGFSIVFILLGASITYFGRLLSAYRSWLRMGGGILIIGFGCYLLFGVKVAFMERERRLHLRSKPAGYAGSVLVGAAFAAGWTPCVGPILGSILVYASASETLAAGIVLLVLYSLGLAVPIFASALLIDRMVARLGSLARFVKIFSVVCGIVLIVMGVLLIADPFRMLVE